MMVGFTIVAIAGDARREVMAAMEKAKTDYSMKRVVILKVQIHI